MDVNGCCCDRYANNIPNKIININRGIVIMMYDKNE
jgi:hypothetical protein